MATPSSNLAWKIPWTEVDYSPWDCKELDMTERLHFSLTGLGHKRGSSDRFSLGGKEGSGKPPWEVTWLWAEPQGLRSICSVNCWVGRKYGKEP